MFIAYLTHDEVNLAVGSKLAASQSAFLDGRWLREGIVSWWHDAALIDLDSLPANERRGVLDQLRAAPMQIPVAVHSYGLESSDVAKLRGNGVRVFRRLNKATLATLVMAVNRKQQPSVEGALAANL
jgi:hypothetical protein